MRDNPLRIDALPAEVQKLCEVMIGIDPNWSLDEWLQQQAEASLELISSELDVEMKTAEQRLKRITDIKNRMSRSTNEREHQNQMNLFDCFSIEYDKSIIGLGSRAVSNDDNYSESHPVSAFLDLLPNEQGDDPLLAVACQNLLIAIDGEIAGGKDFATLEFIVTELDKSGISFEEIDEAIEHLLMSGAIIEVEDDCFITI
ncbi:MAG: hypothetical protein VXV95_03560 [Candidatus Thermoplasmatota archaeon]|nr:hypothetical protein [Candidatus Thermoplasmatota archaeon]MEC8540340.1 hypothetical protein [Candidatus Thermoplasmatota archaeon]